MYELFIFHALEKAVRAVVWDVGVGSHPILRRGSPLTLQTGVDTVCCTHASLMMLARSQCDNIDTRESMVPTVDDEQPR